MTHDPLLYDDLTGHENLSFVCRLFGLDRANERVKAGVGDGWNDVPPGSENRNYVARDEEAFQHSESAAPTILRFCLWTSLKVASTRRRSRCWTRLYWSVSHPRRTVIMTTHNPRPRSSSWEILWPYCRMGVCLMWGTRTPNRRARRIWDRQGPCSEGLPGALCFAILVKDLLLELRTKDILISMLLFGLLVIVVFNFAIDPTPKMVATVAPGILWVSFTFGGVLGLNRSFGLEKDRGNLHGLMLAPVSRDALYFGKMLGNFVFMVIVEAIIYPAFAIMFNLPLLAPGFIPVALLATLAHKRGRNCVQRDGSQH